MSNNTVHDKVTEKRGWTQVRTVASGDLGLCYDARIFRFFPADRS